MRVLILIVALYEAGRRSAAGHAAKAGMNTSGAGGLSAYSSMLMPHQKAETNVCGYALQLPKAGLIQVRHVPAWTLAEVAHSLEER